jgi:hypothetical protein
MKMNNLLNGELGISTKSQATNIKQIPMAQIQNSKENRFDLLILGDWNLFGIWELKLEMDHLEQRPTCLFG